MLYTVKAKCVTSEYILTDYAQMIHIWDDCLDITPGDEYYFLCKPQGICTRILRCIPVSKNSTDQLDND